MEQELRDRWAGVLGGGRAASDGLGALLARYREPHRRYHSLVHVLRVLRDVDALLSTETVADPDAIRLAAWYHDAVYDPEATGGANEEASARLAEHALGELGQSRARIDAVVRLVRATAGHEPSQPDEAVLIDADLAVLGADAATYGAYARGVRREYGHLDEATWRHGRALVLRSFLGRSIIYSTVAGHRWEATARANLAAELAGLGSTGPTGGTLVPVDAPDTVVEALDHLRAEGYTVDFQIGPEVLACSRCGTDHPVGDLIADHVYRFEGISDPGDEAIVLGVTCPACGTKGVIVSAYGPEADPDELAGIVLIAQRYAG